MENQGVRVAHLGLGRWGKNILRNLYELGVLEVACDPSQAIVAERSKQYPDLRFTTDPEEVINDPKIQAIAISTPAASHYQVAKAALKAGKDVFVEKPLALRVKEGLELCKLAHEYGRILMVGHVLQYHPAVCKLKSMISGGELGKINYLLSNRLNLGALRTEENILWSFAPHDISVMLHLFGECPVRVAAFGGDYLNKGVYDTTLSTLEFKNGTKGHIFVSWLHPFKEQKLVVVGSKAMAVFDDVAEHKLMLYPHEVQWRDGKIPIAQMQDGKPVQLDPGEPLRLELVHFIRCLITREQPKTNGLEALRVLKILSSLEDSIRGGKPSDVQDVVEFSFGELGRAAV